METADFGRYRVLGEFARGACGVVYRALDRDLDREVALKTPRPGERSRETLLRFDREARLAARLTHPNLVPVLDAGTRRGRPFYVMPLLEGGTLRPPRPPGEVCRIGRGLASALAYLHARGVVHRDLKPANVMMCDGVPLLFDLGTARAPREPRLTRVGELLGTLEYLPPEGLQGRSLDAGPAADVWSLGILLVELLEGTPPFEGRSLLERGARALGDPRPPLPGVDRSVAAWIARCLDPDPSGRPNAGDLAEALRFPRAPSQIRPRRPWGAAAAPACSGLV
jgi:serine/threonine protein kinase